MAVGNSLHSHIVQVSEAEIRVLHPAPACGVASVAQVSFAEGNSGMCSAGGVKIAVADVRASTIAVASGAHVALLAVREDGACAS